MASRMIRCAIALAFDIAFILTVLLILTAIYPDWLDKLIKPFAIVLRDATPSLAQKARELLPAPINQRIDEIAHMKFIPYEQWSADERRFARFAKWLARQLTGMEMQIAIYESDNSAVAFYKPLRKQIAFNRRQLGRNFFATRHISKWVSLIIHECAHRRGYKHDEVWAREVERLSGIAFEIAYRERSTIERLLNYASK